jgi:hypothetical protein
MADSSGGSTAATVALVGLLAAILGAIVTGGFNYLSHQGDMDAKMIELSVGILRSEPTPETAPLREWAIDTIDKRANFSFNPVQKSILLKQPLPFQPPSVKTLCDVLQRPEYAIKGKTVYDQDWADVMEESLIAACGWKRPLKRPAILDAPAKSQEN